MNKFIKSSFVLATLTVLFILAFVISTTFASCQYSYHAPAIVGDASDIAGNPVRNCSVTLYNMDKSVVRVTYTDERGFYFFKDLLSKGVLNQGWYLVSWEKDGIPVTWRMAGVYSPNVVDWYTKNAIDPDSTYYATLIGPPSLTDQLLWYNGAVRSFAVSSNPADYDDSWKSSNVSYNDTSFEGEIRLSALDDKGTIFIAQSTGVYRFTIIGGAYENTSMNYHTWPLNRDNTISYPDMSLWGWQTEIYLTKNKAINNSTYQAGVLLSNYSNIIGDSAPRDTRMDAVMAGNGSYVDIPLEENDTVTLICNDNLDFSDNTGCMYVSVVNIEPLILQPVNASVSATINTSNNWMHNYLPQIIVPANASGFSTIQRALLPLASIMISASILALWTLIDKLLVLLFGGIKGYLQGVYSTWEKRMRKTMAVRRIPFLFGLSSIEILIVIVSALLLGGAFAYVRDELFVLQGFAVLVVVAGFTSVAHELAHWYVARTYRKDVEYKFWGVGTLTLILTTLLRYPFASPARALINGTETLDKKALGLIYLAGPIMSILLSIGFLFLDMYGHGLDGIGLIGFNLGMMTCVYQLMPIKPLEGTQVFAWNKLVWSIVFIPALVFYLGMLIFVLP